MYAIEIKNLTKSFTYYEKEKGLKGSFKNFFNRKELIKQAVGGISFSIKEGEIVGFLGPNGAGKTTTMKMLSGILYPTSGEASVLGYKPWERKNEFKKQFSIVMGQKSQLWPDLPAEDSLWLTKCIYELSDEEYEKNSNQLIDLLGVRQQLKTQVRRLSLGERMKFELITCLLHNPKVIFLDEPTIGLDIISQRTIREFIIEYNRTHNVTILITSHNISDIENLCHRVIVINHGDIVFDGNVDMIKGALGDIKLINMKFSSSVEQDALLAFGEIRDYEPFSATIAVKSNEIRKTASKLLEVLPVLDFTIEDVSLEEGVVKIYEKP